MRSGVAPSSSDHAKRKVAPSARMTKYPTNETTPSAKRCRSENRKRRTGAPTLLLEGAGSTGLIVMARTTYRQEQRSHSAVASPCEATLRRDDKMLIV